MKKQIYLSILSLSFIFLLTGCIPQISNIQNIQNQQPINSSEPITEPTPQPSSNDIVIQTDKLEYFQGETLKAILTNYSDKSIWYEGRSCERPFFSVKKLEGSGWENIFINYPLVITVMPEICEIKPKGKLEFNWDLKIIKDGEEKTDASSGKYRIAFGYLAASDTRQSVEVYSNVFDIKLSPSADFYSCKENSDCTKIKADQCGCNQGGSATAINKKYEKDWEELMKQKTACPQVISLHPSCSATVQPDCIEGKCKLIY